MNITPRDIVPMKLFNLLFLSIVLTYSGLMRSEPSPDDYSMFQSDQQETDKKWDLLENGVSVKKVDEIFMAYTTPKKTVWDLHQRAKNNFRKNCMKSFPHVGFCKCLSGEADKVLFPAIEGYIAVLVDDREMVTAYGYNESIIQGFKGARNKCSKLLK